MAYQPNLGRIPPECEILDEQGNVTGYRAVHVVLFNGFSTSKAGHAPWPAGGGRPPTNWRISKPPHPFEIAEWSFA